MKFLSATGVAQLACDAAQATSRTARKVIVAARKGVAAAR